MNTSKTFLLHAHRVGLVAAVLVTSFNNSATAQAPDLQTTMSALTFREIGPALMGGRISSLAVVESKPQFFYLGTATGGLWKTENHGTSWTPLFDDQPTSTIGDVTIDQNNPNLVWVGTGEPQNRQSSPWGNGVYKSTDGGATWSNMGLEKTKHIGRMLIHPRNPETVYVAAVGDLWAPNPERGVYRTQDGGASWELVLYVDENTGAIDLIMDPNDPSTLFAAMYQRRRTGFGFNGGGPGSGIYRTMDGGENWTEMTEGLPEGDKGRIGLDVYQQNGNVIYALIEADARSAGQGFGRSSGPSESGLFRSADRGTTWEKMSDTNPRPMYYSQIRIDPSNPDRIYVLGTSLMVSDDAGRTFRSDGAAEVHVDHHDLWINPKDPDHLILGSDGGVSASWDGTAHWRMFDNLALGQFYTIAHDMRDPYYVCGGLQDNGSWCAPSDTRSNQGIRTRDWYNVGSGDGFFTVMHPTNTSLMFAESQGGNLIRVNLETMERTRMRPIGRPGADGEMPQLRWNWDTPVVLSSHDENTLYIGSNVLFRSNDLGQSFTAVSDDLTWSVDRDTLSIMGVLGSSAQMSRNDGQSSYGNLTAIAESPLNEAVIYTGADDGTARAWDAGSGALLREFQGHGDIVLCLQVAGDVLYSGSGDKTVRSVRFVRPSLAPQLRERAATFASASDLPAGPPLMCGEATLFDTSWPHAGPPVNACTARARESIPKAVEPRPLPRRERVWIFELLASAAHRRAKPGADRRAAADHVVRLWSTMRPTVSLE